MTPSTTNTAARELLAVLLTRVFCDGYKSGHHDTVEGGYTDVFYVDRDTYWREKIDEEYADDIATLTQQQGGEQEADVEQAIRTAQRFCDEKETLYERLKYISRDPPSRIAAAIRTLITALRTKQPAASEGDGRVPEAELLALVAGPYMYHHKMNELQEREAKGFDRCRELTMENIRIWCATRQAMFAVNTSKQATGEAVDRLQALVACAYQLAGYHDAPEIWLDRLSQAANGDDLPDADTLMDELLPYRPDTTPPRHPADEGRDAGRETLRTIVEYLLDDETMIPRVSGGTKKFVLAEMGKLAALQAGAP